MRRQAIGALAVAVLAVAALSAQRGGGDNQPGRKWSEAELKRFAGAVRAGRKLTPAAWPNGARSTRRNSKAPPTQRTSAR